MFIVFGHCGIIKRPRCVSHLILCFDTNAPDCKFYTLYIFEVYSPLHWYLHCHQQNSCELLPDDNQQLVLICDFIWESSTCVPFCFDVWGRCGISPHRW